MNGKRVELLAPAGNYEGFLGAVHAGADAVYLGGPRFGARAYADNLTEEEVCRAIRYAHLHGRKVYLTLNTLIKEREFDDVYAYLRPFCEEGLDGAIIQDLGVFQAAGEWFPQLGRHVSTQMTATGSLGAAYLKELGAKRLVPARELSLAEIREIKQETDIEIETFIHGAVCYCYSGQCLFSSMLGGRSGNRGRCAQPCRLPYRSGADSGKQYPLSLKDMCAAELLGELIGAGIDAFKIEGRMKSPEYAAGVTGVYRKCIDRYYENPEDYFVEKQDMAKLKALYIRSEISQGYYHRHNGRDMVALETPGYTGRDEALEKQVRETYLKDGFRLPVRADILLKKGEEAALSLSCGKVHVTAGGDRVQKADKQPLTQESVRKQVGKCGNTAFYIESLEIRMQEDVFLPVKALNDLRRKALDRLEEEIIKANGFAAGGRNGKAAGCGPQEPGRRKPCRTAQLHVLALTKEQCEAALSCGVKRLYMDDGLCTDAGWLRKFREDSGGMELYLALPYIMRQKDRGFLEKAGKLLEESVFSGVLARNLEEIQYLKGIGGSAHIEIVSDANLYIWNARACQVLGRDCAQAYIPYELNIHEIEELARRAGTAELAISVYGRVPMMISANCVVNTMHGCTAGRYTASGCAAGRHAAGEYTEDGCAAGRYTMGGCAAGGYTAGECAADEYTEGGCATGGYAAGGCSVRSGASGNHAPGGRMPGGILPDSRMPGGRMPDSSIPGSGSRGWEEKGQGFAALTDRLGKTFPVYLKLHAWL